MRFAGTQLTNFIDPTNFDAIGKAAIGGTGIQKRGLMSSEGYVDRTQLKADEMIQSAEFGGQALSAEGAAAGQSAMWSGLSSGIGSLAGGFAKMPKAGKTPGPAPIPTPGLNKGLDVGYGELSNPSYLQLSQTQGITPLYKW